MDHIDKKKHFIFDDQYQEKHYNNNNSLYLYSAFLGAQSALHTRGGISSSTTSVQHPPGWCDGSHSAPQRPSHTQIYWWRGDRVMKSLSVWWWLGGHDGQRPVGEFGQDTPLLFFEGHPGIFNDHRESWTWFNVSSERRCFIQYSVPSLYWGVRTHTDHRVSTPCWPH